MCKVVNIIRERFSLVIMQLLLTSQYELNTERWNNLFIIVTGSNLTRKFVLHVLDILMSLLKN